MSRLATASVWVMGLLYVVAGANHFLNTAAYLPMMPTYLPWHWELVILSGVAEVGLGIAVLIPAVRRPAAWGIVLLLLAVLPANFHIAMNNVPLFGAKEGAGALNWVRIPFQIPLLVWAWWFTRPVPEDETECPDAQQT